MPKLQHLSGLCGRQGQAGTSFPSSRCSLHPWMGSTTLEPLSLLSRAEDVNFAECQAKFGHCSLFYAVLEKASGRASRGWQHLVSELLSLPHLLSGRSFPGVLLARVGGDTGFWVLVARATPRPPSWAELSSFVIPKELRSSCLS
ncbi:hypothetical protein H1C71_028896 [Ictidomys tridecemlineatus]|nr:hypothetical protein H1C71_028896 [Ictidomys tridecemlineatus]KAG3259288.1 hypothetical protein H1C71_028896 [Ictidomys tridecemlineatus]KAG3259289.1 hypothetical protein H1C71_028896 [Ictidomys tridecemlineatus]